MLRLYLSIGFAKAVNNTAVRDLQSRITILKPPAS